MKTLDIIRHAKSSWNFASLDDYSRPLGTRGRKDLVKISQYLIENEIKAPELIVTSPASRAFYTALHLADAWSYPEEKVLLEATLYHADEDETIEVLNEHEEITHIALVGHNPGFTSLVNLISREMLENLPTCGIIRSTFDSESWEEISPSRLTDQLTLFPKLI